MRCLLVDKIISCEPGKHITGIKNVTMSENFLQDHFPGFPVMPGMLQLEAVAQLASWLAFATSKGINKAALLSVASIKFKEFIVPGDQMLIQVALTQQDENGMVCNATIRVGETVKTEIRTIRLAYEAVAEREAPDEAQAYFDFLCGTAPLGAYRHAPVRSL
ncbi:MAG: beta-hydroxyacyl-ACP dehydratase [Desulfobacterota bacterium]|nr:beta-hydroxyacyl-ACP dehydratase [Thermodesulfobacteriota bacterium]